MDAEITRLREEIADLDRALLELLERRFRKAAAVGRLKAERGQPVEVREVEQRVLGRARDSAQLCGASPGVMEAIFEAIIRGSVEVQHRVGVELRARGSQRVLLLGAAGAMGGWLRRFLSSLGHRIEGVDVAWSDLPHGEGRYASLAEVPRIDDYDALLVSVPLTTTGDVITELADLKLTLPVFEIASIKSHLADSLATLRRAGTPVISIHPMFGPSKGIYDTLTIVHAAADDEAAERAAILNLLAHPYLDLVSMPFVRHDRIMGWLLGLSHLTGMLFATALSHSGHDHLELERVASTSFSRQAGTSRSVLEGNTGLYYAIQRLNPYRGEVYAALTTALGGLTGAVEREDSETFAEMLQRAAAMLPE